MPLTADAGASAERPPGPPGPSAADAALGVYRPCQSGQPHCQSAQSPCSEISEPRSGYPAVGARSAPGRHGVRRYFSERAPSRPRRSQPRAARSVQPTGHGPPIGADLKHGARHTGERSERKRAEARRQSTEDDSSAPPPRCRDLSVRNRTKTN